METLNYKVLEGTGYNGYILKDAPVKVMQFGEGNFLRAFVDYFYDIANEKAGYNGKVKLVQPISNFPQMADWINEQEGLYTLYLRGSEKGQKVDAKRVISCVSDCVCPYIDGKWDEVLELARSEDLETIVSNTTEAGIAYTLHILHLFTKIFSCSLLRITLTLEQEQLCQWLQACLTGYLGTGSAFWLIWQINILQFSSIPAVCDTLLECIGQLSLFFYCLENGFLALRHLL